MRTTFVNILTELSRTDDRVMCIIGDTGYSVFEEYEREFGSRFVNVGIAEQNFIGFGAGLAAMGMKPYLYNVVSFMTLRATEQILLDICYQENPVVLVGVGGGFAYGPQGPTHHALQDIAIMSSFPNMTVVCPGDPVEMEAIMRASIDYDKPLYIRIGRSVDSVIHDKPIDFSFGKAIRMTEGDDATLIVTGVMLKNAMDAHMQLKNRGIEVSTYSIPCIKPIDEEVIINVLNQGKPIFIIEEHSVIGGLGDAVGRVLMEHISKMDCLKIPKICKIAVPDTFAPVTGTREYLDDLFGLSVDKIVERIVSTIENE